MSGRSRGACPSAQTCTRSPLATTRPPPGLRRHSRSGPLGTHVGSMAREQSPGLCGPAPLGPLHRLGPQASLQMPALSTRGLWPLCPSCRLSAPQLCRPPNPLPARRILEGQQRGDFPGHVSTSPCSFLPPRSPRYRFILHTASFTRPGPFAAGTRGSRRPSEGTGRAAHRRTRNTASGVDTGVCECEFTSPLLGRLG